MTLCEMHKEGGCGECPNRYVCKDFDVGLGETFEGEVVCLDLKEDKMFATLGFVKVENVWVLHLHGYGVGERHVVKSIALKK